MTIVKYTGDKHGNLTLVLKDPRFKKEYNFSTGSCKCADADAQVIVTENPLAFSVEGLPAIKIFKNTGTPSTDAVTDASNADTVSDTPEA